MPMGAVRNRARVSRVGLAALALTMPIVGGCGDDDDPPVPPPDSSTYAAALAHFLPPPVEGEQPNIFVSSLDQPLALDAQVAVIENLGEDYDVKFVDNPKDAIDLEAEDRPPIDDGLLLGIGTIPAEPPYVTRVEAYRGESNVTAEMVTLVWRTDHWAVADEEPVESEAFVLDE